MPHHPMHATPSILLVAPRAQRRAGQWRAMAALTLAVVLVHVLLLAAAPLVMLAQAEPNAAVNRAFTTRTISVAPPAATAAPARTRRAPGAATKVPPPATQELVPNQAAEAVDIAQAAINTIADTSPPTTASSPAEPSDPTAPEPGAEVPQGAEPPAGEVVRNYAIPGSVRLKYEIRGEAKRFPYFASGELLWLQDGKTYDSRLEISHILLGSRVRTSTGQITRNGLEPTRFGDKVRSEVAAHFEYAKGKVVFSANTPDAPLLPGAQDELSIFMQLSAMLAGEPAKFPPRTEVPFQAVGPKSSELWVFVVGEAEQLILPGGTVRAVKLSRARRGEYDANVDVWLAPEHNYLPLRIRLTYLNGDFADQQWRATQAP